MGVTKIDAYSLSVLSLSEVFKALGHPARLAIVEYLLAKGTCICGDIVDELPLAQASISRHLQALKTAGIIKGQISGTSVCYCLSDEHLDTMLTLINSIKLSIPKTCCDETV
jgi:ArsR family transcriptional regulator, arsenate/arsenite/antimonite-responsive transcriptional repressor